MEHGAYMFMDELAGELPVFYSLDQDGAWTSADGKVQKRISTAPYFPYRVAVAPDDTIWTLGYEMVNLNGDDPAVNKEAHVLRHFDGAGNLIESAFPQSRFSRYQRSSLTHSPLVAARDRVGWYSPYLRVEATYTEVSLNTMTMKVYPGISNRPTAPEMVDAIAVTAGGSIAVCISDHSPSGSVRTTYVFDRASSSWVPVRVPFMSGLTWTPRLIGSDGDNLVFQAGHESGFFSIAH